MPILFAKLALREWQKLPAAVQTRIRAKLEAFAASGQGDVKRLVGRDGLRLRVGDYRVIFYEDGETVVVARVGHRRDVYD